MGTKYYKRAYRTEICKIFNTDPHVELKFYALWAGLEPARVEPIGFQVQLLNHSETTAVRVVSDHCSNIDDDIINLNYRPS